MFGIPTLYLKIGAILLVIGIMTSGYFYIKYLNSELASAQQRQEQLVKDLKEQQEAMDSLRADVQRIVEIQTSMFSRINNAELTSRELARRLQTQFSASALRGRNPSDVEREVNLLARETNRCNELATGAALTDPEKAGQVTNSVCPELLRVR